MARIYKYFYFSLLAGVIIWIVSFILTPIEIVEPIKANTIVLIGLSYAALIMGFNVIKARQNSISEKPKSLDIRFFNVLILLILVSFLLRWIDLFWLREASFLNPPKRNRWVNFNNITDSNAFFYLASVFKSVYFFPFVIYVFTKHYKPYHFKYFYLSLGLLVFPLVEAFLFGIRKPFMEIGLIVFVTYLVSGKFRVNFKSLLLLNLAIIVFIFITGTILFTRETAPDKSLTHTYEKLVNADYNDFVPPNEKVKSYILDDDTPQALKMGTIIVLQTGQYTTHGIFELNHIINRDVPIYYGSYTFYPFKKAISILSKKENFPQEYDIPRKIVYLTAIGGAYLDFKWFGLLFFFLFGMVQKMLFNKAIGNNIYKPIIIYLLLINLFLPIMNYLRGSGIYPFIALLLVLTVIRFLEKLSNEKSPSS